MDTVSKRTVPWNADRKAKAESDRAVEFLAEGRNQRHNFQVRPEADALYASRLEPWSRFLTGVQGKAPEPYWDPMQFMIDECHKRGMEFHAWINPYRTKTTLKSELAPNHVYNIHPEWFVTYGDQLYFDPALPESRRHICMVVSDIVSRYDVDAIHMDDYFILIPLRERISPTMQVLHVLAEVSAIKETGAGAT